MNTPHSDPSRKPDSDISQATPVPTQRGEPSALSPLPPPSERSAGIGGIDAAFILPEKRKVASQDLSQDKLLLAAPRLNIEGRAVPALSGIPLLAKLGQGGMGAVYYGVHPRLQREVAVKVLPFHLAETQPDLIHRFFREARVAAKIQSPYLVGVLDVNEEAGLFFLVMEYVYGISAGGYLKHVKKLGRTGAEESVALEICIAACKGLALAHEDGIVHRDIKPDNLMIPRVRHDETRLDFQGAKLADLGLARGEDLQQSLTGTQSAMGTPGYMAPEQAMDAHSAGPPADVFGMGATLYALLAGQAPFTGTSLTKVIFDTVQAPHPPLQNFRPDVSPAVLALVDRCLSKDPAKRPSHGGELRDALEMCRHALGEPGPTMRADLPDTGALAQAGQPAAREATPATPAHLAGAGTGAIAVNTPSPATPFQPTPAGTPVPTPFQPTPAGMPTPYAMPGQATAATPLPAGTPFAAPAPRRGGVLATVLLLLILGGGGFGGWMWWQQQERERIAREFDTELGHLARLADEGLADTAAVEHALAQLRALEERYPDAGGAGKLRCEQLAARLEAQRAQLGVDGALAELQQKLTEPNVVAGDFETADALLEKHASRKGVDLSRLRAAREALAQRQKDLASRKVRLATLLGEAASLLERDPHQAKTKLEEAQKLGAPSSAAHLPDLLAGLEPPLADRLAAAEHAIAAFEAKKAEAERRKQEEALAQRFLEGLRAGRDAYIAQRLAEAERALDEALKALGVLAHPEKAKAVELLQTVRNELARKEDFTEALARAEDLLRRDDFAEAQKVFEDALARWPNAPDAERARKGISAAKEGLARKEFSDALGKGQVLLLKAQWKEAEDAFTKALERKPNDLDAVKGLTEARYGLAMKEGEDELTASRWTQAEATFRRALEARPLDGQANAGIARAKYGAAMGEGNTALARRDYDGAQMAFERAMKERPGDPDAQRGIARCQAAQAGQARQSVLLRAQRALQAAEFDTAASLFEQALRSDPTDRAAQTGLRAAKGSEYNLDAKTDWGSTGVSLNAGDKVSVTASGSWKAYPLGKTTDASGEGGTPMGRVLNQDDAGHALFSETLIGKIGAAGLPFYVGKDHTFTAPASGELYLRMNEENKWVHNPLIDNSGSMRVTVRVVPAGGIGPIAAPEPPPAQRAILGVQVQDLTAEHKAASGAALQAGAFVVQVVEGSPAARGGLRVQDVIYRYAGREVRGAADLVAATQAAGDGTQRVDFDRKGQRYFANVTMGAVAAPAPALAPGPAPRAAQRIGPFGVYANLRCQGIPVSAQGQPMLVPKDLAKEGYEKFVADRRSWLTVKQGTRVRVEAGGTWHSGPTGDWVSPGGRHKNGKLAIKNWRAFQGPEKEFNIAQLVVYVWEGDEPGKGEFDQIEEAGHCWAYGDEPFEFVMPKDGILRFQQNRDAGYDMTKGCIDVTVTLTPP